MRSSFACGLQHFFFVSLQTFTLKSLWFWMKRDVIVLRFIWEEESGTVMKLIDWLLQPLSIKTGWGEEIGNNDTDRMAEEESGYAGAGYAMIYNLLQPFS